jgi:hypothetical protein
MMFKQKSVAIWGMMLIVALILVAVSPVVQAQDWSFNVAETRVHVYLNGDGTARMGSTWACPTAPTTSPTSAPRSTGCH